MWVEGPHSDAPGFGSWAGARGSRQAGALDPNRGERPERRGGGGDRLSRPFWRSSSGRCPLPPLGPERGEPATAALLRRPPPSPPGAAGLQLALEGGQARGRGAEPRRGAGRGALMDLAACASACVLPAAAAAPGPCRVRTNPARFRGAGPGPGIRGRRGGVGGGARRRRYNPLPTAGRLHTRSLRSPPNSGEPGLRLLLLLLLLSRRRLRRRRRLGPAPALRPARAAQRGLGRVAAARRLGRGRCPARAGGGRSAAPEPRARRVGGAGPRCARPGGGCERRPEASAGPAVGAQGRLQLAAGAGPGVRTGDRWWWQRRRRPQFPSGVLLGADALKYAELPAGSLLKPAPGSERGGGQHRERTEEEAQPPPSAPSVPTPYPAAQEAPRAAGAHSLFLLLLAGAACLSALTARAGRAPQASCSPRHPPPGRAP
ncbi:hypothetical protein H8959_008229 [Pygathrix nigripes]